MSRKIALILTIIYSSAMALAKTQTPSPQPTGPNQSSQHTIVATTNNPAVGNSSPAKEDVGTEKVKWTEAGVIVPIVGFLLQLGISGFGFWFVWQQIKQLNRGIAGETHSRLYDHYLKVNEILSQKPELRPYFYDGKELEQGAEGYDELHSKIEMMSEIIAGLLEHAALQKDNLPGDSWENCWRAYTYERFNKSPELKKFFKANQMWYAKFFCAVVDSCPPVTKNVMLQSNQQTVDEESGHVE